MPLFYQDSHAEKITGCLQAVNQALVSKKLRLTRGPDGDGKDPQAYRAASREFTKKKRLLQVRAKNPSFDLFVCQLESIVLPSPARLDP